MTLPRSWIAIDAAIPPGTALADPHRVLVDPATQVTLSHPHRRLRRVISEPARIADASFRCFARAAWPLATARSASQISRLLPHHMPGACAVA